ncbi:DUF167 family protein [Lacibacterium aquatile]|uniref:UPF0235 protein ACFSM5_03240 n=1 Tax=Lacibacterium aquatile TaxID=1168082 RepID=A0ABW5DL90_9PROT
MSCWRRIEGGFALAVRLTPKGGRDGIDGPVDGGDGHRYLAVRVATAPVEGAANASLIGLLSKRWRLPKSAISLVSGQTARLKHLRIMCDEADIARLLPDLEDHP